MAQRLFWLGGMLLAAGFLLDSALLSADRFFSADQAIELPADAFPPYREGPAGPTERFSAYTDRGSPVPLVAFLDPPPPSRAMLDSEQQWLKRSGLDRYLTRTAPPTGTYVCHDWVFTGGRYSMTGDAVEAILQDNGYEPTQSPQAGDLAVYRWSGTGPAMHTGIVRSVEPGQSVMVESKWAWMGRYLHPAEVYSNPNAVCVFYRSPRPGHLLRGLDRTLPLTNPQALNGDSDTALTIN